MTIPSGSPPDAPSPKGREGQAPPPMSAMSTWGFQRSSSAAGASPGSKISTESPARGIVRNVERPRDRVELGDGSVSVERDASIAQTCEAPIVVRNEIDESVMA